MSYKKKIGHNERVKKANHLHWEPHLAVLSCLIAQKPFWEAIASERSKKWPFDDAHNYNKKKSDKRMTNRNGSAWMKKGSTFSLSKYTISLYR